MLKLFRKRKGFTLTETIVVVALIAIIMASVVAFSGPINSMISNSSAKGDATTINTIIGNYVERRLAYANYIDALVEIDYGSLASNARLVNSFNNAKGFASDPNNTPGMLVFRYEAYTSSGNEIKSSYKLYDVNLKDGTIASINDTATTKTLSDGSVIAVPKSAVFADGFYGNYEYFLGVDSSIGVNTIKQKCYMTFESVSYKFSGDYTGYMIGTDAIKKYYDPSYTTVQDVKGMFEERLGAEKVTFALENIGIAKGTVPEYDGFGNITGIKEGAYGPKGAGVTSCSTLGAGQAGQDIVIFYNIKKY